MKGRTLTVQAVALLAAGSAAIHQARYELGYGTRASHELAVHGHDYLTVVVPLVVAALVLAMAAVLLRVARGGATHAQRPLWALWLAATAALALTFSVQESIEGASLIAGGGWIGLVLAVPAGLLVALALRGASAAEAAAASGPRFGFTVLLSAPAGSPPSVRPPRTATLCLGARAPPSVSVV